MLFIITLKLKQSCRKIADSKQFVFILALIIGVTYTITFYEGKQLYKVIEPIFRSKDIVLANTALAAELPKVISEPITKDTSVMGIIKRLSKEQDIDWKLIYSVCMKESGCNPNLKCEKQTGHCDSGYSFGAYQIYNPSLDPQRKAMAENFEQATMWTIQNGYRFKNDPATFFKNHNGLYKTTNQWYIDGAMAIYNSL